MRSFEDKREIYAHAWHDLAIDADKVSAFDQAAHTIIAGRSRYAAISTKTGVPWAVIGLAHYRESSCNFRTHLHNGDSLSAKTHHDPAGRPPGNPPFDFDYSACDALHIDKLDSYTWDSVERVAYALETFNGWGYANHGIPSAYLWAGTNQYRGGKYVADNVLDLHAVDRQLGVMGILKRIAALEPEAIPSSVHEPEITTTTYKAGKGDQEPEGEGEPLPAPKEPTANEQHSEAHDDLKKESWFYSTKNWLLKKLGIPVAGGTVGASLLDDPVGALGQAVWFIKAHGFLIVGSAVLIIIAVEAWQFNSRVKAMGEKQ